MSKITTVSTILLTAFIVALPSVVTPHKKNTCLKNNNGIGNNHDIFVELPTNSQTLEDEANEILSIRIDPGNPGQVKKIKEELTEQGFGTTEVDFVVAQLIDAEKKLKETAFQCLDIDPPVDVNYTFFAD